MSRETMPDDRRRQRGIALVAVVLLLVVGVGLIALSFSVTSQRSRETSDRDILQRLHRAAENAIAVKAHEMSTRGDENPITLTAEGITVTATPLTPREAPENRVIDATASEGGIRLRVVGTLEETQPFTPVFEHAIFAARRLTVDGAISTESFDGALGLPSAANLGREGHVGGNGAMEIGAAATSIAGKVYHVDGAAPTLGAGVTTGGLEPMAAPRLLPDLIGTTVTDARAAVTSNPTIRVNGTPTAVTVDGSLTLGGNSDVELAAGTYIVRDLMITGGADVRFGGDVRIIATNVVVDSGASLAIGAQNVELYYQDSLLVRGGSTIGVSPDGDGQVLAQRFAAYGQPGSTVEIADAQVRGAFYAPEGDATLRAPLQLEGTLVGRDVLVFGVPTLTGDDPGLPGGHFDVDVWYRKKDGTMSLTKHDYHEHEYDDAHDTDSFVFFGTTTNGITGASQGTEVKGKWAALVAAQGGGTEVELALSNTHHGTGALTVTLADGTKHTLDARTGGAGPVFKLSDVRDMSLRYKTLAELIGTEPGIVHKDTKDRGKENVPADPANVKKGSFGLSLFKRNADGSRGNLLYEFRTYFHNNTGKPWPPTDLGSGTDDDTDPSAALSRRVRFDTSLRNFRMQPNGPRTYRVGTVFPVPSGTDVGATVGDPR